ncbi:MAG: ChaB family protein, partial [Gemmatimonadota bacterium]
MPYQRVADLPKSVRDALPPSVLSVWRAAFNAASEEYGEGDEGRLASIAWGAVERAGYEKDDAGRWRKVTKAAETYKPTATIAANAKRALEVRASKPPSQRGMTAVGIARARQLMNREALSEDTVRRMKAYFDRHAVDKEGATWGDQGKGWQAWMAWGGDEGRSWAEAIVRRLDRAEKSFDVAKVDEDQRLVFGWASIIENDDGTPLVDLQGDIITPDALEKAAYRFVLDSRKAGEMHQRTDGIGRLVESFVLTPEKAAALGIDKRSGWWVGFKIDDDST